jgi:hypothetical protein
MRSGWNCISVRFMTAILGRRQPFWTSWCIAGVAISVDFEMLKLRAFKIELRYQHAVYFTLGRGVDGTPLTKVTWLDG